MKKEKIIIGGASGYWGEASYATAQLLKLDNIDFLVYDYLAEITISILARAREKDPLKGFAADFITSALKPNLKLISNKGVRVISNAGGLNPRACAEMINEEVDVQGLNLKVGFVEGDELIDRSDEFRNEIGLETGQRFPDKKNIASINAYLGAFPIAALLDKGADIIITGRCVDSAVTLAACIHSFCWGKNDLELLASGSLAGHILECGPQSTGGNFTDWQKAKNIFDIGYPVAQIDSNGKIVITKPDNTGGIVSRATVAEQMLYEIGNPQSYMLPDVICDFSQVRLEQIGKNKVSIDGAIGRTPSGKLKVSVTYKDGYRAGQILCFNGTKARQKAEVFANAAIKRSINFLKQINANDFTETNFEVFGGKPLEGEYEEVMLKVAVRHSDQDAVEFFLKELAGMMLATPPGLSFFTGAGRPKPSPVVRLFSFFIKNDSLKISLNYCGQKSDFKTISPNTPHSDPILIPPPVKNKVQSDLKSIRVPLEKLAYARSGDKGDTVNIGVISRDPKYLPWIWNTLTEEKIKDVFSKYLMGEVERFHLPGSSSMNILMHEVLGGGGIASLRNDSQGKGYSQMLLAVYILIPEILIT